MITKRQSFWVGIAVFVTVYLVVHVMLGNETMKNLLALLGAWQLGAVGQYVWEWVSDKYVEKS